MLPTGFRPCVIVMIFSHQKIFLISSFVSCSSNSNYTAYVYCSYSEEWTHSWPELTRHVLTTIYHCIRTYFSLSKDTATLWSSLTCEYRTIFICLVFRWITWDIGTTVYLKKEFLYFFFIAIWFYEMEISYECDAYLLLSYSRMKTLILHHPL